MFLTHVLADHQRPLNALYFSLAGPCFCHRGVPAAIGVHMSIGIVRSAHAKC